MSDEATIEVFTQGKQDRTLFGMIGHLIVSREVQKELGAPIAAEPGDVWHVLSDSTGFALTQLQMAEKSAHVRFVYAGTAAARKSLLRAVHDTLRQLGIGEVMSIAPETDRLWESLGYEPSASSRGKYLTWFARLRGVSAGAK